MENKKKEKNTHTHVYLSHFLYRRNYHNTVSKLYFSEKTNLLLLSFSRQVVYDSLPSNHLILCRPLLLPPSIFPSIRVFSNESVLHITWPKYWSFSFTISPSKKHSGLIPFKSHWLDLLAVQGTLKSLLQHHSSKAQFKA